MTTEKRRYKPQWDLDRDFGSRKPGAKEARCSCIFARIRQFEAEHIEKLTSQTLAEALDTYDGICEEIAILMAEAVLNYQKHQNDEVVAKDYQSLLEWCARCDAVLCRFAIAIQALDRSIIEAECANSKILENYKSYIREIFRSKEHTLSPTEETLIAKLGVVTDEAWYKLHEGVLARTTFSLQGKEVTISDVVELANNGATDEIRRQATEELSNGLKRSEYTLLSIFNNIALTHRIRGEIKRYKSSEMRRYHADNISKQAVDNMLAAITEHYDKVCHRYYKLKARILGKQKLQYWDRCSKVTLAGEFEKKYTYEDAIDLVLTVYKAFSNKFYDIAYKMVTESWVDVYPKEGKVSGAFAYPMPANKHPFIMLNFYGSLRDVMTIAHEFGHGIHMVLSSKQKYIVSNPPLNISETASTFCEKLVHEHLLEKERNPKKRIEMICARLDDVMSTVFRQAAFLKFERQLHCIRKDRELAAREVDEIWRSVLVESLGAAVELQPCVDNLWSYITHFTRSPFYVYSYSFGGLFVEGLFARYKELGKDFVGKYEEALSFGGTKTCAEIANMFGMDTDTNEFWDSALKYIEKEVDELETICDSALCN